MPDDDAYDKFIGRTSTNFYNTTMNDGVSNAEDKGMRVREKLMAQQKAKDAESEKNKQQENKVAICKFRYFPVICRQILKIFFHSTIHM
jgi:hypothetical protein